jgi:hypothetical protein
MYGKIAVPDHGIRPDRFNDLVLRDDVASTSEQYAEDRTCARSY